MMTRGICKMATRQLEKLGYQACVAEDGKAAIAMYQRAMEEGSPFAAVIMDLTIPGGMGGKEAVGQLLKLDPMAVVRGSSHTLFFPKQAQLPSCLYPIRTEPLYHSTRHAHTLFFLKPMT